MDNFLLDFKAVKNLLSKYSIHYSGEIIESERDVINKGNVAGFPIVLKIISPEIIHKSENDAVILNIQDETALVQTYRKMADTIKTLNNSDNASIILQKMIKSGFEMLIGAKQDICYGPVTMIGMGGKYVELWEDAAPGVGVLSKDDVNRILTLTKANAVLNGYRGDVLDREKVIEAAVQVSRLMDENPEIIELDLNPVIVYENEIQIVDARLIKGEPVIHPESHKISSKVKKMNHLFSPRKAALFGASKTGTAGGTILKNMKEFGKFYPVNPKYKMLNGQKCYSQIKDLPKNIDLGIFAVGSAKTIDVFTEFAEHGGKSAVIVSDGFAEIGRQDLEVQLKQIADQHNIPFIGPNCLGVIDNFSGVNTMFTPEIKTNIIKKSSGIGVISQSGGIGIELFEMLAGDNIPVGRWVSCGNAADISIPELLYHMGEDPKIKIITVYLEGLKNGVQFVKVGKEVSKKKPVIIIKGGVGGGSAATMSHTASLAGSNQAFKAACDQAGFFLFEELTEDPKVLVNTLSILTTHNRSHGNRVAVVTVGGGAGILLADQITNEGLMLADFTDGSKQKLQSILTNKYKTENTQQNNKINERICSNPLDLFGDCDDNRLLEAIKILDEDPQVDIILAVIYFQVPGFSEYILEHLVEISNITKKTLLLAPRGYSDYISNNRKYLKSKMVSTYTVPFIKSLDMAVRIWKKYDIDKNK